MTDNNEPWYECEDCEECRESEEECNVEYEKLVTWDAEQDSWICDSCGRPL